MYNRDILESSAGWNGFEYISDTAVHTTSGSAVFTSIQVTADAAIATLVSESPSTITGNAISGAVIPKGVVVYGRFTSLSLASGTALAYKGV